MREVIALLEQVANNLEDKGMMKDAEMLDAAMNSVEAGLVSKAVLPLLATAIMSFAQQNGMQMSKQEIAKWLENPQQKALIEQASKNVMTPAGLAQTHKYETANPIHVEQTKTTGGGRYSPNT